MTATGQRLDEMIPGMEDRLRISPKATRLVLAWDARDRGEELTPDQKYALEEWSFHQSTEGRTVTEDELDRQVLRAAVRLAYGLQP